MPTPKPIPGTFWGRNLKRWAIPVVLALLAGGSAAAQAPQPTFDWLGNVSQKATYNAPAWDQVATSSWAFTSALRPQFSYGPLKFQADTTWTLPLTASLTSTAPTTAVSEAYFRWSASDSLDLTFGQKRFNLGVGQTFTVGDSINPVIGFFDQKTGFRGASVEWSPVSWASVSAAISTEGARADNLAGAGQVGLLFDQLQLTGSLVAQKDKTFNPALGASYDLFGVILTAEGAAEFLPQGLRPSGAVATWKAPEAWTSPALSGSTGARWTPTIGDWDLTFSGEYLYWAQGWTAEETDAWHAALKTTAASAAALVRSTLPLRSQNNAFFRVGASSAGVFSLVTFFAVDLQDRSVLGQTTAIWTFWDNIDITANLLAAQGDSGSAWETLGTTKDRYQASFATTYHF